jgi:hypothetical protein
MLAANEMANELNEAADDLSEEDYVPEEEAYACDEEFETMVKEAVDSFGCQCHLLELVVKDACSASKVCDSIIRFHYLSILQLEAVSDLIQDMKNLATAHKRSSQTGDYLAAHNGNVMRVFTRESPTRWYVWCYLVYCSKCEGHHC